MTDYQLLDEVPPEFTENVPGETSVDPFACTQCGQLCKSDRGRKMHETKAHGSANPSADGPTVRKGGKSLEADLTTMLAGLAMAVSMFEAYDGMVINEAGPNVARAWSNLAMRNPAVDRMLRSMMGGVSYGEVIIATAMMVLPILAHHHVLPDKLMPMFTMPVPDAD